MTDNLPRYQTAVIAQNTGPTNENRILHPLRGGKTKINVRLDCGTSD